jgi:putative dehydrogenase
VIAPTGVTFVDAGIIGAPPKPDTPGPLFYASGPGAAGLSLLQQHGIRVKVLNGPIGAASGLKMSYGGLTKGLTALASAMMLAATRFGAAEEFAAELVDSQPVLLKMLQRSVPDMYPKAYRWVAEMQEVAAFAGDSSPATADIYRGIAALYEHLAQDRPESKQDIDALTAFMAMTHGRG